MPLRVKNNRFLKENKKKNKERIAWGLTVITDLAAAVPDQGQRPTQKRCG